MNSKIVAGVLCFVAVSTQGCVLAAAGAGAEAGYVLTQEKRTATETLEDQRITSAVKAKLLADPVVSGLNINVDTFKSVVTLRGVLDSATEIQKARDIAASVGGVREVKTDLHVSTRG